MIDKPARMTLLSLEPCPVQVCLCNRRICCSCKVMVMHSKKNHQSLVASSDHLCVSRSISCSWLEPEQVACARMHPIPPKALTRTVASLSREPACTQHQWLLTQSPGYLPCSEDSAKLSRHGSVHRLKLHVLSATGASSRKETVT